MDVKMKGSHMGSNVEVSSVYRKLCSSPMTD